jgi:pimeloyl-ACP methyl ester carboxylesterase
MTGFAERRWTSPDGLSLYARDYAGADGEARLPVICLHGLTRNSKDFEDVAPLIASSGRRVLAPDVRGRGLSDRDPNPAHYEPRTYARDVLALMDRLGIARAVFLGTSMGGLITMTLAALQSRRVAAAVLNDVGPEIAPEGVARILSYTGKGAQIDNWDDAANYLKGINGPFFPALAEDDWQRFARRTFREGPSGPELDYDAAIAGPLRMPGKATALVAGLLFRRLARRRPTLLLRGVLSDLVSAPIAGRMRKAAPGMLYAEIPNVGHAPMLDEPEALAAIRSFLASVP